MRLLTIVVFGVFVLTALAAGQTTRPFAKADGRSFRYGVNTHFGWHKAEDQPKLLAAIDELGVDLVRDSVDWDQIQPKENVWTFDAMDKLVDGLQSKGVELQPLLGFSARWASTGDPNAKDWNDWNKSPPRVGPFVNFAKAMVGRYHDRIRYWEIWNEPDISFWRGPTAAYIELFNQASTAIAEADPNSRVLNGGFAMAKREPNPDFVRDFVRDAAIENWNVWTYHDYHTFEQTVARREEIRSLYAARPFVIPIWINEGGFHTLLPGGEQQQAITLVKKLAAAPALGVSAYVWYDLIDDGTKPNEPEHHFGLLRADFSRKPAFFAYQTVIREVGSRRFVERLSVGTTKRNLWAIVYQGQAADSENVLVIWQEGDGTEEPLRLSADGAQIRLIHDWRGEQRDSSPFEIPPVTNEPIFVHYAGELRLRVISKDERSEKEELKNQNRKK